MRTAYLTVGIVALMFVAAFGALRFAPSAQAGAPADEPAPEAVRFGNNAAFYPPLQTAAKTSDIIQLKLSAWDDATGGTSSGPSGLSGAYYWGNQIEGTGTTVWTDLRDYGRHNDGAGNDSFWASDAVRVASTLKCDYLAVPVFIDSTSGGGRPATPPPITPSGSDLVTSVTVAVDNDAPDVNLVNVVYPPNQAALKTGDQFLVVANVSDVPDPVACPKSKGAMPYGVDRVVVDLRLVDGRLSEGTYDDGQHGDGSPGDNTFGTLELTLLSQKTGEFDIPVTVFDIANNKTMTSGGAMPKMKVDNTPPTVSNVGVTYPNPKATKDGEKIRVSASVADSGAVSGIFRAYVDASTIGGDPMTPMTGAGTMTTGDITVATGGKTGKYRLRVIAEDIAGNLAEQSVDVRVFNGVTQVTISGLQANEIVSCDYKFRAVTQNAVRANISIGGGGISIQGMMAYNVTNGTWEYAVNTIPFDDKTPSFSVTVDAFGPFDGAVPGATASQTFRVDNNDPTIEISAPTGLDYVAKSIAWTQVKIDDAHIKLKQYSIDGEGWIDVGTAWNTETVNDGKHTVWFRGVDEAARESRVSLPLTVDNHAPTGEVVQQPPANFPINNDFTFVFQVSDTVAVHTVDFAIDTSFNVRLNPRADGFYEVKVNTSRIGDGTHTFQVTARDKAYEFAEVNKDAKNNVKMADHQTLVPATAGSFNIDNTAPTAEWTDPQAMQAPQKDQVILSFTVTDSPAPPVGAGVDWVKIRIDNGEWETLPAGSGDEYTKTLITGKKDNGQHVVDIWVADKLGQQARYQRFYSVDNADSTLLFAFIIPILLFVVLFIGIFLFHRAKAKVIRDTPPPVQPAEGGG